MIIKDRIKNNRFVRGTYFLYQHYLGNLNRKKFGYCGEHVTLTPPLYLSNPKNIFLLGDNGLQRATVMTTNAKLIMKPHSGASSGFTVITGNHAMILGRFYRSITEEEKPSNIDKDVIVESDVWIGTNVTLLSGVTVGRGCTVASGAIITKDMPPYHLIAGIPAKPIKAKWTIDQILEHESKLYPENERYTREQLEEIFAKYTK